MVNMFFITTIHTTLLTLMVVLSLHIVGAQVMQSNNYQIQSDSINFGGGFSSSTNFQQESTFGEIATGRSNSSNFQLRAGYQQMQVSFIALSGGITASMTPALGGLSGGESNGSTTLNVITDNSGGYQLSVAATTDPAMQKFPDTIANYVPAGVAPDVTFTTLTDDVHFGFGVGGSDVIERYQVNAGACDNGSGTATAETCWEGLSTSPVQFAQGSANQPNGATTTLYFKVGIGGGTAVVPGVYTATTTVTAIAL